MRAHRHTVAGRRAHTHAVARAHKHAGTCVDVVRMDVGTTHVVGLQRVGHTDQWLARRHLALALDGDPQPQDPAVQPGGGYRVDGTQCHIEQAILDKDGPGLIPTPVAGVSAGRVVVDGKGDRIVPSTFSCCSFASPFLRRMKPESAPSFALVTRYIFCYNGVIRTSPGSFAYSIASNRPRSVAQSVPSLLALFDSGVLPKRTGKHVSSGIVLTWVTTY